MSNRPHGGKTVSASFPYRPDLTESGMEEGINESYERLDELLEKLQQSTQKT
ncbi:MAG: hypothetical protein LUP95_07220 [Euryarchaeota archaeon]|nr:hypothetical protein [Euryarchaeota archaeon]